MRSVLRLYAVVFLVSISQSVVTASSICPQEHIIQPCKCSERSNEIQIWCSYGDLNSIMNSIRVIGQMIPRIVDELILENNLLPSLPGQMFSSIKILRLMLRENGLQRVSTNWLAGLENVLQEIYIVEPELRSFPDESLVTLPKLEALTLSAGLLTKMPAIFGLSRLRYIQIEAAAMSDVSANNFQGLPFLEQLHITSASKLRRLDEDFIHDLPKLSILNFTQCSLTYIHPRALARLPALTEISFSGNQFTDARLVGMAIRDLPNLATVRLDRNNIMRLEEGSFVDISSLTNLYLNDNKIVNIHRAAFHRLPRLRSLDLGNNEIRIIHPESFLPPRENLVEELWLNNNHIEHSITLRLLLDSLPHLRLLDMSNNFLEDLSFGIVQNHLHLEMLILENNKLLKLGREAFVGLPSLRELKLANNSLAYHLGTPYWNLPALKGLDLSRNNFEHIDRFLLSGLPSLRRFDISHNLLKTIEPATFVGSPFLEHINISNNDLQMLSSLTFSQLHRLFALDISHNNLSQGMSGIPRNVEYLYMAGNNMMVITTAMMHEFQLSSLKLLDLSGNKIHKIPDTSLSALCTLRTLLLNDNSLQVIDQAVFENLPQLRILNLANNKLIMIKKDSFKKLQHLYHLNLGKNRLEIFEPEILAHNPELKRLDLSGNRLTDLASNVFSSNKKIEEVNLAGNSLSTFPMAVAGIPFLQVVDLSRNQMKSLPANVLSTMPALKELYLSGNKLQELNFGVFDKLPNLTMLDFERNEIQRIGMRALHNLPNLVMVKLSKNKISTVAKSAFENLPVLQSVEMQENQLQDIDKEAFTTCPSLLMLNLSNNMLSEVERAGLRGLKTLEALDLSHNRITKLSMDSVKDLNFLVLLKLDNNRLCNIEGTPFEKMFRLRMLSLRDNKMTSLAESAFSKLRSSILYFDIEGNPVKCSCNMLWLQAWLQQDEQRHAGPRCSDGILLREHRISKNNCDDTLESVPGCENPPNLTLNITVTQVEMKTLPPSVIPSTVQTQSTSKPNSYLKPLPEETDYFDPKFIEYHENNSKTVPQNKSTIPPEIMTHFIPGDTPTLYAGMKSKANVTKPASPQQSSSAFTFFGMPLPSLNLNNFWNSGKAIDKSKKHGRHESWPPSEPEIQKDGFVPVLPGIGGFVPMNMTDDRNSSGHHVFGHATIAKVAPPRKELADIDFFSDLDPPTRSNRNVSHKDSLSVTSTQKPMQSTNHAEQNRKYVTEQPKPTFISEPVFSINDRVHEEPNIDDRIYENTPIVKLGPEMTTIKELKDNISSPSPLSEFLIPGGQVSGSSTGRSIISKVQLIPGPSPHAEDSQSSHLRLAKSSLHSSTTSPSATNENKNNSKNWYFQNYNRSNIEPFIGHYPAKVSISYQNNPLLPLFFSGLFLIFVF